MEIRIFFAALFICICSLLLDYFTKKKFSDISKINIVVQTICCFTMFVDVLYMIFTIEM